MKQTVPWPWKLPARSAWRLKMPRLLDEAQRRAAQEQSLSKLTAIWAARLIRKPFYKPLFENYTSCLMSQKYLLISLPRKLRKTRVRSLPKCSKVNQLEIEVAINKMTKFREILQQSLITDRCNNKGARK